MSKPRSGRLSRLGAALAAALVFGVAATAAACPANSHRVGIKPIGDGKAIEICDCDDGYGRLGEAESCLAHAEQSKTLEAARDKAATIARSSVSLVWHRMRAFDHLAGAHMLEQYREDFHLILVEIGTLATAVVSASPQTGAIYGGLLTVELARYGVFLAKAAGCHYADAEIKSACEGVVHAVSVFETRTRALWDAHRRLQDYRRAYSL